MLPEPLRLALTVVGHPEYGKVEIIHRDKSSKIVTLDNSAVGLMLEVFRSVQARPGLSADEKKQQLWQLLWKMKESPFVQRGSMQAHYNYIVEQIWRLRQQRGGNKGPRISTAWPELDRLDFSQLYQFAGWLQRLHEAAIKHRQSMAGLCQPAAGPGAATAGGKAKAGQHTSTGESPQRAGQKQAGRVPSESGLQTTALSGQQAGVRQAMAPAIPETGRQAAVQATSSSESMSSEFWASLLEQNDRFRVSKSSRKK
ncbi:MAG: hypothetical protein ACOY81_03630 [Bacillota bacterium]